MSFTEWLESHFQDFGGTLAVAALAVAALASFGLLLRLLFWGRLEPGRLRKDLLSIVGATLADGPKGTIKEVGAQLVRMWRDPEGDASIVVQSAQEADRIAWRLLRTAARQGRLARTGPRSAKRLWSDLGHRMLLTADEIAAAHCDPRACAGAFATKIEAVLKQSNADPGETAAEELRGGLQSLYGEWLTQPQTQPLIQALMARRAADDLQIVKQHSAAAHDLLSGRTDRMSEGISRYFGIPRPNRQMLPRQPLVDRLVEAITAPIEGDRSVCVIGAGGCGKTTLTMLAVRDDRVPDAFPDGIFWVTLGQEPDVAARQGIWLSLIFDRPLSFPNAEAATAFLRSHFENRKALLVVDDVWTLSCLKHFAVGGPRCRLLVTTREERIGSDLAGKVLRLAELLPEEAVELLRLRSRSTPEGEDLLALQDLADALGHFPLAVELAGQQLRLGSSPRLLLANLRTEIELIRQLKVRGGERETNPEVARAVSLDACLSLSFAVLAPDELRRLTQLAAFRTITPFTAAASARLWDLDEAEAAALLQQFWEISLLERAHLTDTEAPEAFRFHSVVRAKAFSLLVQGETDRETPGPAELIRTYLRRCNPRTPGHWHDAADDGHLLDNLIYYLTALGDRESLLSILRSRCNLGEFQPNAWHELRKARSQEELFATDIREIREFACHSRDQDDESCLRLVATSAAAIVSLGDMNKDIGLPLALTLLRAGLWTAGQAASHAKRRFTPMEIATLAREVAGTLRTQLVRDALKLASVQAERPDMLFVLILGAELLEGGGRARTARLAADILVAHLAEINRTGWFTRGCLSETGVTAMRSALRLHQSFGAEIAENIVIPFAGAFLDALEHWRPSYNPGSNDVEAVRREMRNTTAAVEAAILIAQQGPGDSARAKSWLSWLFTSPDAYIGIHDAALAFKAGALGVIDCSEEWLRDKAIAAIQDIDFYGKTEPTTLLWRYDGVAGLIALAAARFGRDPIVFQALENRPVFGRGRTLFHAGCIAGHSDALDRGELPLDPRSTLARILNNLRSHGSLLAKGNAVGASREVLGLAPALVEAGLVQKYCRKDRLIEDLRRLRDQVDRARLFEILLPTLEQTPIDELLSFCGSFYHPASAGRAWLVAARLADASQKHRFVEQATVWLAQSHSPPEALEILSAHAAAFSGDAAFGIARSAAALAAGVGDAEQLNSSFARASVAMPPEIRHARLRERFWHLPDTMPTHAPLAPVPRSSALVCPPFWAYEKELLESGATYELSDAAFRQLVLKHLTGSAIGPPRTRFCAELADFAQEFAQRDLDGLSTLIADTIYEVALMYR